jgi:hypothetical protein
MNQQELPISISINVTHHIYDLAPALERLGHDVYDAVYQVLSSDNDPTVTLNSVFVDYEQDDASVTINYLIGYQTNNDNDTGASNQIIHEINSIEGVLSVFRVPPKKESVNVIPAWLSDYDLG